MSFEPAAASVQLHLDTWPRSCDGPFHNRCASGTSRGLALVVAISEDFCLGYW